MSSQLFMTEDCCLISMSHCKMSCRYNMRQYWLPTTLSLYPSVHKNILLELSTHPGSLPALITVYRECKKTKLITQLHIDDSLKNALCSANDEIRSDVIALICLSSKPSGLFLVHWFFFSPRQAQGFILRNRYNIQGSMCFCCVLIDNI